LEQSLEEMVFPEKLKEQFDHTMQLHSPAIQGSALPARLNLEAQILNRPRRLPGFPMASTLQTEDLEMIGPSDYLGIEFEGTDVTREPVIAVKK